MPGYLLKLERIAIAGADDLVIQSLLDRQQFSDPLGTAAAQGISSASWPMFGLLWPSGAQLAARMAVHPVVRGARVLEIGCGLALASLVGHRRGNDMTASDCHPLTAGFLLENLRLNALPPMKYRRGHWGMQETGLAGDTACSTSSSAATCCTSATPGACSPPSSAATPAPPPRCGSSTPTAATGRPSTGRWPTKASACASSGWTSLRPWTVWRIGGGC